MCDRRISGYKDIRHFDIHEETVTIGRFTMLTWGSDCGMIMLSEGMK